MAKKYGRCKECNNNAIPIDETTQVVGTLEKDTYEPELNITFLADKGKKYQIWECPTCA